jgi:DNA-binding NtrC family response regulator
MTEVLVHAGFDVVNACRGAEAQRLLTDMADFDLLLTDIDLTDGVNGLQLAGFWHDVLPGRPIVYMGTEYSRLARGLAPHESFLLKSFDAATLLQAVDTALEDAALQAFLPSPLYRPDHAH